MAPPVNDGPFSFHLERAWRAAQPGPDPEAGHSQQLPQDHDLSHLRRRRPGVQRPEVFSGQPPGFCRPGHRKGPTSADQADWRLPDDGGSHEDEGYFHQPCHQRQQQQQRLWC